MYPRVYMKRIEFGVEIDTELEELFWMVDECIDELKRKSHRSSCRLGTTIEKKNDKKRVNDTWNLIHGEGGLEDLSQELFEESGLLERQRKKIESEKNVTTI